MRALLAGQRQAPAERASTSQDKKEEDYVWIFVCTVVEMREAKWGGGMRFVRMF